MSDALTDIARDDRKSLLMYELKYLIQDDKKPIEAPEVQELIEKITSIPRGYCSGRIDKNKLIEWIKRGCKE